jgi:sugar-specific transcriptional regulator TrmB
MTTQNTQPATLKLNKPPPQSQVDLTGAEILVNLGLTGRQAKVYLALLRCGVGGVKEITKASGVHRQETYVMLNNLCELGLVHRKVTYPTLYVPTPASEGIKLLIQQKTSQLNTLHLQTNRLIKTYSNLFPLPKEADVKPCFGTVHEADRGKTYHRTIKATQHSIDLFCSWMRFKQFCIHYEDDLKAALRRGVMVRIIAEHPLWHRLPRWVKEAEKSSVNFGFKVVPSSPLVGVSVFDGNLAAVASNPEVSVMRGPEFWTNHPGLVVACQSYFDTLWAGLR